MATFAVAGAILIMLWLAGRYWRQLTYKRATPFMTRKMYPDRSSGVLIVYFDGAFNRPFEHAGEVFGLLRLYGDVIMPDYRVDRYNHEKVYEETHDLVATTLKREHYRHLVAIGGSMGAINCVRLARDVAERFSSVQVSAIGIDGALDNTTLPKGQRELAPYARWIHPGPVWNSVSWPLKWLLWLRPLPIDQCEPSVSSERAWAHLRAMRVFRLSAILDMISAIAHAKLPLSCELEGIDAVYLRSGTDVVLDGDVAELRWRDVFPGAPVIPVVSGVHLSFVEHPEDFERALVRGLELLLGME